MSTLERKTRGNDKDAICRIPAAKRMQCPTLPGLDCRRGGSASARSPIGTLHFFKPRFAILSADGRSQSIQMSNFYRAKTAIILLHRTLVAQHVWNMCTLVCTSKPFSEAMRAEKKSNTIVATKFLSLLLNVLCKTMTPNVPRLPLRRRSTMLYRFPTRMFTLPKPIMLCEQRRLCSGCTSQLMSLLYHDI